MIIELEVTSLRIGAWKSLKMCEIYYGTLPLRSFDLQTLAAKEEEKGREEEKAGKKWKKGKRII